MPRVFIPQVPSRYDAGAGQRVPSVNLRPAAEFGELVPMLPSIGMEAMLSPQPVTNKMKAALSDFTDQDFLLCLGDPTAIGIAFALAARANNGKVRVLKWLKQERRYIVQEVTL